MIGAISIPTPVQSLTVVPDSLILSNLFGYDGSYNIADTLSPGRGYWVKANQDGLIILDPSASKTFSARGRIKSPISTKYLEPPPLQK